MATFPASMADGTVVVIPSNGVNLIQTAPGVPSVALQASRAIPYPQYGAQQLGIFTNAPQQVLQKSSMERFLSAETKVLGAIQIMIGLIHIGFGAVSLCLIRSQRYYLNVAGIGGYPFWGGIFFIVSGSLCVAVANRPNRGLVQSSVGMNITSAIMALVGILLYVCDLIVSSDYLYRATILVSVGFGLSVVLLLFSLLEFCIAVSLAHFGCQATCCGNKQPTMHFLPCQVVPDTAVTAESNTSPPPATYENMIATSQ